MTSPIPLAEALADVDLDLRLDEALAPECDMEDWCHATALWTMRCEGCSEVSFACQEHRDQVDSWGEVSCIKCDYDMPYPMRWLPL